MCLSRIKDRTGGWRNCIWCYSLSETARFAFTEPLSMANFTVLQPKMNENFLISLVLPWKMGELRTCRWKRGACALSRAQIHQWTQTATWNGNAARDTDSFISFSQLEINFASLSQLARNCSAKFSQQLCALEWWMRRNCSLSLARFCARILPSLHPLGRYRHHLFLLSDNEEDLVGPFCVGSRISPSRNQWREIQTSHYYYYSIYFISFSRNVFPILLKSIDCIFNERINNKY